MICPYTLVRFAAVGFVVTTAIAGRTSPRVAHFDIRTHTSAGSRALIESYRDDGARNNGAVQATMAAGEARLKDTVPNLQVKINPTTKTPEIVGLGTSGGALTAPSKARPETTVREFVVTNAALFGLTAMQAAQLRTAADYTNPGGNLSWIELEQLINGIPVFQGTIRAAVRRDGAIARTTGNLAAGLDYKLLAIRPVLSAAEAVAAAARTIGVEIDPRGLPPPMLENDGNTQIFPVGRFERETKVDLVYFPIEPGVVRLAYSTVLWEPVDAYFVLVDAVTGELLWRKNITNDQTQTATYSVYGSDSPTPRSPTIATPGSGIQGNPVPRSTFTFVSELPAFDNLGWIPDGQNTTSGNNVDAGLDVSTPDGVDGNGRATGSPNRVFNFDYIPAGQPGEQAPTLANYRNGVVTGSLAAIRSLPAIYTAGMAVGVSIAVAPGANTQAQAIEETPPSGWVVSAINNGGSFDSVNGKVKWGPYFDNTARTLSYSATPPTGTTGTKTFSGTASFDGVGVAITGNSTISSGGGNGAPVVVTSGGSLNYVVGQAATPIDPGLTVSDGDSANLTGGSVALTGNLSNGQDVLGFVNGGGISGSYNAGTGVLTLSGTASVAAYQNALRGVTYTNTSQTPSTLPRTVTFTVSDGTLNGSGSRGINVMSTGSLAAIRSLPAIYTAGMAVGVSIAVAPGANTQAQAIEETPPSGWVVSAINNGGSFDSVNGKVKWGPYFDNTARTLSYSATPPTGTTGTKTFSGTASFDGVGVAITGNSTISDSAQTFFLTLLAEPSGAGVINAVPAPDSKGKYAAGTVVTLTAVANPGFAFDEFTGDISSSQNPAQVAMDGNKTVTATFSTDRITPSSGEYFGLITSSGSEQGPPVFAHGTSGFLRLKVTRSGRFSAALIYGGERETVRGRFSDGGFSGKIRRRHDSSLEVIFVGGSDQIIGTIADGSARSELIADRNVFSKRKNRPEEAGKYTILIQPPDPTQSSLPGGFGAARMIVKPSGLVRVSGRLGDGSSFSPGSALSKAHTSPLYAALYRKDGCILGPIVFEDLAGESDASGLLDWFKPLRLRDRLYPNGFTTSVALQASAFASPRRRERILSLPPGPNNARLIFRDRNIGPVSGGELVTIDERNRVLSASDNIKMSIKRRSGLFSGTLRNVGTKRPIKFLGAIFQKQNIGAGFFFGDGETGSVLLEANL